MQSNCSFNSRLLDLFPWRNWAARDATPADVVQAMSRTCSQNYLARREF
jgi:hypothetical protein